MARAWKVQALVWASELAMRTCEAWGLLGRVVVVGSPVEVGVGVEEDPDPASRRLVLGGGGTRAVDGTGGGGL